MTDGFSKMLLMGIIYRDLIQNLYVTRRISVSEFASPFSAWYKGYISATRIKILKCKIFWANLHKGIHLNSLYCRDKPTQIQFFPSDSAWFLELWLFTTLHLSGKEQTSLSSISSLQIIRCFLLFYYICVSIDPEFLLEGFPSSPVWN